MKLTNTIRDAFIRAAMDDVPQEDFSEQARKIISAYAVSKLPPKVRAIWNDKATRAFVSTFYCHESRSFSCCVPGISDLKFDAATRESVDALALKRDAQNKRLGELRAQLRAVAYSVSTRKALADALPEFAKYLPADEQAANRSVPAIANVVTAFAAAGWPKDGKKARTKAPA